MIRAVFERDKQSGKVSLRLTGHARAAEHGKDIVCAAASILAYTVAQTLQFMHEDGTLKDKPVYQLNAGDALVEATTDEESYSEVLHTFFVAQVGYHLLSHNYPQYVELTSFGEAEEQP